MTRCLLLSLFQFLILPTYSQDLGQLVIGLGNIAISTDDSSKDFGNISSFLSRELSKGGIAYSESDVTQFLVHTTIAYGYEKEIDISGTPMRVAEVEFDFDIKDRRGEVSFGHFSTSIPESGENTSVLIRNAAKQLKKYSRDFQQFIIETQKNILAYYEQHCDRLMGEVEREIAMENFDNAILLAGQVPSEVSCYNQAGELLLKAYHMKLEKSCDILVQECFILIDKNALDVAYEKALLIPHNSRCSGRVKEVLDNVAHKACEQFILQAEAFYASKDFDKSVQCLAGLETVSTNCSDRKTALEKKMKASLDAAARQQWEFEMQQYNDQKAERKANFDQDVSILNREMTLKEKEEAARLEMDKVQMSYKHSERMQQMDKDAEIKAKELEVAPELEKYRTRRDIEISKNQRAVESLRIKETSTLYRALLSN